ncbi:1652_t:CDS:2, partial [Entrophospora sp. SA101]
LLEILEKGFNNIVTGDESWFHYFTVSSKEANKVWISKEGIVTRIVVPKGQSVNAKYYSNIILPDVFSNWK